MMDPNNCISCPAASRKAQLTFVVCLMKMSGFFFAANRKNGTSRSQGSLSASDTMAKKCLLLSIILLTIQLPHTTSLHVMLDVHNSDSAPEELKHLLFIYSAHSWSYIAIHCNMKCVASHASAHQTLPPLPINSTLAQLKGSSPRRTCDSISL